MQEQLKLRAVLAEFIGTFVFFTIGAGSICTLTQWGPGVSSPSMSATATQNGIEKWASM